MAATAAPETGKRVVQIKAFMTSVKKTNSLNANDKY